MPQPVHDLGHPITRVTSPASMSRFHKMKKSTDMSSLDSATNGVTPEPPTRASPIPQAAIPNGKSASPLVERSNIMPIGAHSPSPQTVSSKDPKAAAAAAQDMRNIVRRKLTGFVGFANLPNQWHRKSVRKGFNFNVMVVGKSAAFLTGSSPCDNIRRSLT